MSAAAAAGGDRARFASALAVALVLELAAIAALMRVPFPDAEMPAPRHPARTRVHLARLPPPLPPAPPAPKAPTPPAAVPAPPPPAPRVAAPVPKPHHTAAPRPKARPRPKSRPAPPSAVPLPAPAAPAAARTPAPDAAPAPGVDEMRAYAELLASRVRNNTDDPPAVKRGEESGEVVVSITVSPDGRIVSAVVTRGSGHADIDQSTLDGVRATHMPPFTAHMPQRQETFGLRFREDDS